MTVWNKKPINYSLLSAVARAIFINYFQRQQNSRIFRIEEHSQETKILLTHKNEVKNDLMTLSLSLLNALHTPFSPLYAANVVDATMRSH